MVTKSKAKTKDKVKRKPLFTGLTLEEEYLSRVLSGLPTKRIEKQLLRGREADAKAKRARVAKKRRASSWQ